MSKVKDVSDVNEAQVTNVTFEVSLDSIEALQSLCGQYNENLRYIEERTNASVQDRGAHFQISGSAAATELATSLIKRLAKNISDGASATLDDINMALTDNLSNDTSNITTSKDVVLRPRAGVVVKGRNPRQRTYLKDILSHDICFGVGPAGTGKTYLAVACAAQALIDQEVERIVLVRPAVEAGERLGFLPGDIGQKVDPYLRPLYDALYEMLGFERVGRLLEKGVIELAPLAYMRGRTLSRAFVILDEAQNTTIEQMKMFLTRTGMGSRAVITGDISQIDLPRGTESGLKHAIAILDDVNGININRFSAQDVVRHPLVQRIVEAYESHQDD